MLKTKESHGFITLKSPFFEVDFLNGIRRIIPSVKYSKNKCFLEIERGKDDIYATLVSMFILARFSLQHTPPNIYCSGKSNGRLGYLQYVEQDEENKPDQYKSNDYTQYYYNQKGTYNYHWIAGSICGRETTTKELKAKSSEGGTVIWFNNEVKYEYGDLCLGGASKSFGQQKIIKNRCYPLAISVFSRCGTPAISGLYDNKIIDNSSMILMDCYSDDCLPGFYTENCDHETDAYCNGNGTPEFGRTSDGFGCDCTSFTDNIFCEDTSKNVFGDDQGVTVGYYYGANYHETPAKNISNFNDVDLFVPYATIQMTANLFIPQNTDVEFQMTSSPEAQLFIDGNMVCGSESLQADFSCPTETIPEKTYTSERKRYQRGTYTITAKIKVGCIFQNSSFSLKWKFYRWYKNNPTDFEPIPNRYLGKK